MANIFLDANDAFTQSSTNTNDSIFGRSGGTENVILQGNPTGTRLDGNIEVVQVAGTAAGTTLQVNATTGQLELVSGGIVFATFTGGLNQAVSLRFTDGDVRLSQTGANAFTIANPANAANNVTINPTTPQAGGAVTLGNQTSTAGGTTSVGPTTPAGGQTFSFTASTDNLVGASGDDTFNGVLQAAGATGTTVQPGDVISGGAGTDTLSISVAGALGAGYTLSAVRTTDVEKVLLSNFDSAAFDNIIDTALMTGLTTVGLSASSASGDTTFSGMNSLVAAEMRNGAADLTLTYNAAAVAGSSDVQNLAVSNVTAGTFIANGSESINIATSLVKSSLTAVASDALKTLTITGDQDLTITNAVDFVAGTNNDTTIDATIDASALTGKLNVTADLNDTKITAGTADDTINMAGFLTKNDIIDGGAGTDTLTLEAAALTDQFAQVSNIETVRFNANDTSLAARTYDVSKLSSGVTTVAIDVDDNNDGANNEAITNLGSQAVIIRNSSDDSTTDDTGVVITGATDTAADTLNVTLIETTETGDERDIDTLDVANFETVNLVSSKETTTTGLIINNVDTLTASSAKTVSVTGNSDLVIDSITGGAMTAFNASGLAGKLTAMFATNDKVTATAAQQDTTFIFGATLNNEDTIVGGMGSKDKVTADASGLTATTGALKMSGVETLELTTGGNNTLSFSGVTGLSTLQVSANTQTLTNFDLASKIVSTAANTLNVTAANAAGSSDTLTVEYKNTANSTNVLKASAIENLNIILNDTDNTATETQTMTLTDFTGTSVNVTQSADSAAARNVALGTLNQSVTSVDMSGTKGTQSVNLSNASAATTVGLSGAGVATVTGSTRTDVFNVAETAGVTHVIDGGAGTDTLNITVANGFNNAGSITNVENVNITVKAGNDVTITTAFTAAVDNIKVLGGNSLSTFTTGNLVTDIQTLDASGFGGNVVATLADDQADSTFTITGGALATDRLNYKITAAGTDTLQSTGVEIIGLDVDETSTLDLSRTTGVTTVDVDVAAGKTFTVDAVTNQTVKMSAAGSNTSVVEAKLANATGSSDAITFELNGSIADGAQLKTDDIETVNIKIATNDESISLAGLAMTATGAVMSLNATGNKALTVSALNADVTTINASGMESGGSFVQTGRSNTGVQTATGSSGNDTFIMSNSGDVLAGGAGTDTLTIAQNAVLGGIEVDLSATGDQVTTYNGSANAAVQSGFESINLSGYTGSFGAQVTGSSAANTITGTVNADVINAGAGNDAIVATTGNDVVDAGAGADTFQFTDELIEANSGTTATFAGGDGVDILSITTATDGLADADFRGLTSIETLNLANGTNSIVLGTNANTTGIVTVNGGTGADTIVTGAGVQTITGGEGADIITGGLGADTIILTETTAAKDKVVVTSGLTVDTVTGYAAGSATTSDELNLKLGTDGLEGAGAVFAGKTIDLVEVTAAATSSVTAAVSGLQTLTAGATADADANVFLLHLGTTTFANAAAAVDALEVGGAAALSFEGTVSANDAFVFAYENTSGSVTIAIANFVNDDANGTTAAATGVGNLEGADLVTLTGVSDITALAAADFVFV